MPLHEYSERFRTAFEEESDFTVLGVNSGLVYDTFEQSLSPATPFTVPQATYVQALWHTDAPYASYPSALDDRRTREAYHTSGFDVFSASPASLQMHITCRWDGCDAQVQRTKAAVRTHLQNSHFKKAQSSSAKKRGVAIRCRWDGCTLERMHATNVWRHVYEKHAHVTEKVQCKLCMAEFTRVGSLRRHRECCPGPTA
ncbi:uncharacterized protein B0H18DRAFT_960187 [Fomitopsis serialis]|uniref:uncharacterized protein n=1 Tax=Fomitopsis serialis TaxID=139415 RepID=UPI002008C061|nr:uncharacterized protein B0H18DRAFT_960187 [Neoantrodia serialis]KAH9913721.1 hypothetical protein B0H18DRAFT_960187 [Neoantrodia serialis]